MTCYLERSKVRELLIEQPDESLYITEQILAEVDALPIVTAEDILRAAQRPAGCGASDHIGDANDMVAAEANSLVTEWLGLFDPPPQIDFQQSEFLQQGIASAIRKHAKPTQGGDKGEAKPFAWVIPGEDNGDLNGFMAAMAWKEGEFTKPLYAAPQPASNAGSEPDDLLERLDDQGLYSKAERIQMIKDAAIEIRRRRDVAYEAWNCGERDEHFQRGFNLALKQSAEVVRFCGECNCPRMTVDAIKALSLPSTHQSAPDFLPSHTSGERLPSGDAAGSGADTAHDPGCQSGDFGPCDCSLSSTDLGSGK